MKKSIVMFLSIATLVECDKKETATTDLAGDLNEMTTPSLYADSGTMTEDSVSAKENSAGYVSLNDEDKKFADAAPKGLMMEVIESEPAAKNVANTTVKSLGEIMVKDHTKANNELKT